MLQEQPHDSRIAFPRSPVQGGPAVLILLVYITPRGQQRCNCTKIPSLYSLD